MKEFIRMAPYLALVCGWVLIGFALRLSDRRARVIIDSHRRFTIAALLAVAMPSLSLGRVDLQTSVDSENIIIMYLCGIFPEVGMLLHHVEGSSKNRCRVVLSNRSEEFFGVQQRHDRWRWIPSKSGRAPRKLAPLCLRQLNALPSGHRAHNLRSKFGNGVSRFRKDVGRNVDVTNGDVGEFGVGDGQTVATNHSIKASFNPLGVGAIVRVLEDQLCPRAADLPPCCIQISVTGETNFVQLESDPGFPPHALFGSFHRGPSFRDEQGHDLCGRNKGVARGNSRVSVLGVDRGRRSPKIIWRERPEGAGG